MVDAMSRPNTRRKCRRPPQGRGLAWRRHRASGHCKPEQTTAELMARLLGVGVRIALRSHPGGPPETRAQTQA